jgi:hypothetical protein
MGVSKAYRNSADHQRDWDELIARLSAKAKPVVSKQALAGRASAARRRKKVIEP